MNFSTKHNLKKLIRTKLSFRKYGSDFLTFDKKIIVTDYSEEGQKHGSWIACNVRTGEVIAKSISKETLKNSIILHLIKLAE